MTKKTVALQKKGNFNFEKLIVKPNPNVLKELMNKYGLESKSKVKKTSATKYFSGEEKEKKKPTPKAKSKPKAKPKKKPSPKAKPVHTFFTDDEEGETNSE